MKSRDIFGYSFNAIKLRKLRAALTTLGVVIGIAAIVALLSVTQGLQTTITGQLQQGLATDTLLVSPGSSGFGSGSGNSGGGGFGGGGAGGLGGGTDSNFILYVNYTDQINGISPDIESSFAVIQQSGYLENSTGAKRAVTITGVDFAQYARVYATTFVAKTGIISTTPSGSDVVVGSRIETFQSNGTIFINADTAASVIWTNNSRVPFVNETYTAHVTGVLDRVGGFNIGGPSDTSIYIPISQAESFFGSDQASMIIVKLRTSDSATIERVSKAITEYFGNQVTVISSTAILGLVNTIFSTIQLFLGGIAAISLLVAGIGIMNIMIVSLIERTREIGILKALGTKSRTVLSIFLCESVIIGLMGAIIGIILGWALANAVAVIFSTGIFGGSANVTINPMLTPEVIIGALGFGIGISVIFALYPAWRASKLKPVEALRYE
jgi:putative ABC transport system permease protein